MFFFSTSIKTEINKDIIYKSTRKVAYVHIWTRPNFSIYFQITASWTSIWVSNFTYSKYIIYYLYYKINFSCHPYFESIKLVLPTIPINHRILLVYPEMSVLQAKDQGQQLSRCDKVIGACTWYEGGIFSTWIFEGI